MKIKRKDIKKKKSKGLKPSKDKHFIKKPSIDEIMAIHKSLK